MTHLHTITAGCRRTARRIVRRLDDRGASAVEYGLLITGVAALIVAVVFLFGGAIGGMFKDTCTTISTARSAGPSC